jgi:TATA-box binding protein (TBP) (component of TFIID and TFIIIB)
VGSHSLPQTYLAAHRLRFLLAQEGRPTKFAEFRLVNMVYNREKKTDHGVDIAAINRDHQDTTNYLPLDFPGLKLMMRKQHVNMRIFDTQKFVAMGVTRPRTVDGIFSEAMELAEQHPDYSLPESSKRYQYRNERLLEVRSEHVL